jgi:DNA-binding response OmpR family regulator
LRLLWLLIPPIKTDLLERSQIVPCRILIVDDDEFVLEALEIDLTQAGYEVLRATNGRTALQQCYACQPHLILLDIMLPATDGWALCRRLRNTTTIPLIIMTALGLQEDISQGFESGADDYLVKPVNFNILMAKIKALLRRTYLRKKADALPSSTLAHHGLVIDLETHEVSLDGNRIRLSPTEYKRLVCLMQHRHRGFGSNWTKLYAKENQAL